jgi:adenosylhomocysteine nucleosidase
MFRVALVAAMEREVRPLIKGWWANEREHGGRRFRFFENGEAVVVCGGIGSQAARRAAEAVIVLYGPSVVYSVGYAGALDSNEKVGDLIRPSRVINASDGSSTQIEGGQGVLVSYGLVASAAQKSRLRESFGAQAVDMEASGVAQATEARGVEFRAIKVVSDEFDFELPATDRFVDTEGHFHEARFAMSVAVRPWLWARVVLLARNSTHAARALCDELERVVESKFSPNSAEGVRGK